MNSQQPTANSQQPDACAAPGFSADALKERARTLTALLRQAAPEIISDGQIDIRRLQQLLKPDQPDPPAAQEHYELGWAGKAAARREIQQTTSDTLLPGAGNPPQAPHMLIEGENLQVLRILQKSYYGKVKMIYIDPPYNTGNDSFVYPDDYSETLAEYQRRTGDKNEAGFLNRQSLWKKNTKENGHYHSAWLSMMYPRLYLARNLLRDDGVIFISIDDNEAANLKLLCDEIFGEENFVAKLPTIMNLKGNNDEFAFSGTHEYTLVYARDKSSSHFNELNINEDELCDWQQDELGFYKQGANLKATGINAPREKRPNLYFPIFIDDAGNVLVTDDDEAPKNYSNGWITLYPITNRQEMSWRWSKEKFRNNANDIIISRTADISIYKKQRPSMGDLPSKRPKTVFYKPEYSSGNGTAQIKALFRNKVFHNPKPINLISDFVRIGADHDALILDFFAGSGTTMQAVMELNVEDGGKRQCICVQIPEKLEENSEAYQAGYRSIADITRARIAKVIEKLKKEQPEKTAGLACAQFTLSPSHFRQWRTDVKEDQLHGQLEIFRQSEKTSPQTGHAQTAMLAELLLKMGLGALGVQAIAKSETVAGLTVHRVLLNENRELWLCFEPYQSALKDEIAKARPAQVVLLNSCFTGEKADEQLANLQLELQGLGIALTVI